MPEPQCTVKACCEGTHPTHTLTHSRQAAGAAAMGAAAAPAAKGAAWACMGTGDNCEAAFVGQQA